MSQKDIWVCGGSFFLEALLIYEHPNRPTHLLYLNLYLLGERYWSHLCCVQVVYPLMVVYPDSPGNHVYFPTPLGPCSILYGEIQICFVASVPRTWKSESGFSGVMKWRVQWPSHLSSEAGQGLISSTARDPWLSLAHRLRKTFSELNFLLIWLFYFIGTLICFVLFLMRSLSHTIEKRLAV